MQKAISKYGLAAHLALLAVAPLFLFAFCGDSVWTARTLLWLSLLAAVWMFVAPSCRKDEMPHEARARVASAVFADPLFWFSVVLVLFATVRWLNVGVSMVYDAEAKAWILAGPGFDFLPGSVEGTGALPAATAVAAMVLMQSCRHALGKSARVCFLFAGAFLAGVAALSAVVACACGHVRALALASCPVEDAAYSGTAFGLYFMGSIVATACSFERKWQRVLPLLAIGISGCSVGLYLFAPEMTIMACAAGAILVLLAGLAYAYVRIGMLAVPKILAFLLVVAVIPTLVIAGVVPDAIKDLRFANLVETGRVFGDRLLQSREVLSGIAAKVWNENPWLGTGVGSFALDIGFNATEGDWAVVASRQATTLNGWWQMLAERGIVGTLLFVVPVLFLVWTYLARLSALVAQGVKRRRLSAVLPVHPCCIVGPLAVVLVAACGFFDCAFLRPETSLAAVAMFAIAGSAFPAVREKQDGEMEMEK